MDKDNNVILDEKSESRLYVGNLDTRITEGDIKEFNRQWSGSDKLRVAESLYFNEYNLLNRSIKRAALIKMFSPFGKIVFEDFLWHTRGPKRGEPRGYAFVQFSTKEEAELATEKMNGKLACGRPLVVRLARDKYLMEMEGKRGISSGGSELNKSNMSGNGSGQTSRSAKIAAIKNKLKAMEEEDKCKKRQKQN